MRTGRPRAWCHGTIQDPVSTNAFKKRTRIVERKRALVNFLGGRCIDCGYDKHIAALEFDHRRGTKITTVSRLLVSATWSKVMEEVAKCDLVCSNCHSIRTYGRCYA